MSPQFYYVPSFVYYNEASNIDFYHEKRHHDVWGWGFGVMTFLNANFVVNINNYSGRKAPNPFLFLFAVLFASRLAPYLIYAR